MSAPGRYPVSAWRAAAAGGLLGVVLLTVAACGGGSNSTGSSASGSTPSSFDFGSNDARKAAAFGDSITLGVLEEKKVRSKLQTSNSYPSVLQSMLRGLDPAWRVVNRGVGGERTGAGVSRFPAVLTIDRPGFALIMEGTNDADAGGDAPAIVANLESMVLAAQGNRTIPIIGTIPPNFRNDPGARATVDQANAMIRAMAQRRGVVLAEIFNGMNDRSLFGQAPDRDPLHPNDRGYQVMAGIWFDAMQRAVPQGTATALHRKRR